MTMRLKIRGRRGDWFAKVEGYEHRLPIMWAHDMNRNRITTNWMEKARDHTGHMRQRFVDYFEPFIESETEVVVANSHTPDGATNSIKNYIGVFRVRVAAISPEIDLEILDRVAHAKDR